MSLDVSTVRAPVAVGSGKKLRCWPVLLLPPITQSRRVKCQTAQLLYIRGSRHQVLSSKLHGQQNPARPRYVGR